MVKMMMKNKLKQNKKKQLKVLAKNFMLKCMTISCCCPLFISIIPCPIMIKKLKIS